MSIITKTYDGMQVDFTGDGWFNATAVAAKFGKRPVDWLKLPETKRYIAALAKRGNVKESHFARTRRGGRMGEAGTWLHPKLGVAFARWLDLDFAIWCDEQIDRLLRGDAKDWKLARHEAASSFKVMADAILYTRTEAGKASAPYHFSNEARLVNWALSGAFKGLDRDSLEKHELDLLAKLEVRNTVLIAIGMKYDDRKHKLYSYVQAWRAANPGVRLLEVA